MRQAGPEGDLWKKCRSCGLGKARSRSPVARAARGDRGWFRPSGLQAALPLEAVDEVLFLAESEELEELEDLLSDEPDEAAVDDAELPESDEAGGVEDEVLVFEPRESLR